MIWICSGLPATLRCSHSAHDPASSKYPAFMNANKVMLASRSQQNR